MRCWFQSRRCSPGVLVLRNMTTASIVLLWLFVCELRALHDRRDYLCRSFPLFLDERIQHLLHFDSGTVLLPIRTWNMSRSNRRRAVHSYLRRPLRRKSQCRVGNWPLLRKEEMGGARYQADCSSCSLIQQMGAGVREASAWIGHGGTASR